MQADRSVRHQTGSAVELLQLARQGVLLRRRWDQRQPTAEVRRQLLARLAAVQTLAHRALVASVGSDQPPAEQLVQFVQQQIEEDDRYLADLVEDPHRPEEVSAFAIECFRDDLHWLGTQVAVLDGCRGVDFLGRLLLEQESLARDLESCEEAWTRSRRATDSGAAGVAAVVGRPAVRLAGSTAGERTGAIQALRRAADRLRRLALARQLEGLTGQAEPADPAGWLGRWRAASHLAMNVDRAGQDEPGPEGDEGRTEPIEPQGQRVEAIRQEASRRWMAAVSDLQQPERQKAIDEAAEQLVDAAYESLTFLEDLPLRRAVGNLEILHGDLDTCLEAARQGGSAGTVRILRRCRYRVACEQQDRRLAWRMERCFGHRWVAALERLVLLLLLLFCVMLVAEGPLLRYEARRRGFSTLRTGQSVVEPVLAWMDLGICLVFLAEFSLKLGLAQRRGLYFWRNWLTGLLPAIPVGFLAYATHHLAMAEEGEWLVLVRLLRYLRLPRMARWLRIARPTLRVARLVGFALRASDRLVRQLTPVLNWNVVLFEQGAVVLGQPPHQARLAAVRERFYHRAMERRNGLPLAARLQLIGNRIEDLLATLAAPGIDAAPAAVRLASSDRREVALERVIAWLLSATPAAISERVGRNVAHSVAQWCRGLDVFGLRRLPLVRDLVAAGHLPSPYEATAQVANRVGLALHGLLDRLYWLADLYGTVTAPQLVDSLGEYLVKGSARPARRLVLFGAAFLAVTYLAGWVPWPALHHLAEVLRRVVGWPLVVLGGICLVFFVLGLWLRQIAGQASEFYSQVADAQFIRGTRRQKRRAAQRYRSLLDERVIRPEKELADSEAAVRWAEETAALMWDDYLDGAPFHPSDTRTSSQLLGNLALVSLRDTRLALPRRQRARLKRLDLINNRLSLRGPYLWFHFISRSVSQQTAKLVIDYNAFALPLERAESAEDWEVVRYLQWLSRRWRCPVEALELPEPFRRRCESLGNDVPVTTPPVAEARFFQGSDFTALHFLTSDPELDANIRRRYGPLVADLVRRDRRNNIRRIFRTYPFYRWPRPQRTFNPLEFYIRHFAGGRVLWLPVKLAWWTALFAWHGARLVWRIVSEVLEPRVGDVESLEEPDPYAVAIRKIHRMRKPLFVECLRLRAAVDPEYLGIRFPGPGETQAAPATAQVQQDLEMLQAAPLLKREIQQLTKNRQQQMLQFRRLLTNWQPAVSSASALRAMAIAYVLDYRGARRWLETTQRLKQSLDEVLAEGTPRLISVLLSPNALWRWCRWHGRIRRLFTQSAFASYGPTEKAACRRALWLHPQLLRDARRLTGPRAPAPDPMAYALQTLAAVGRDPESWTRQLVTLRAVQTLSLIDLKVYADLVAELGQYDQRPAQTAGRTKPAGPSS